MISAFAFSSEQLCKWRRLLSLFLLGCPWLWQDSSSRYLRPRLSSYSRGSAVWSVTAAKEDSPQWAYQNVVPQIRLVHNEIFLLDARSFSLFLFFYFFIFLTPLHHIISMHILLSVFYTFPKVLTKRICQRMKSFFNWWSFPLFSWPKCVIQGLYC